MKRALLGLARRPTMIMIDGNCAPQLHDCFADCAVQTVIAGDDLIPSISAASIVAKTYRDALMVRLSASYPGYGLAQHFGYGTPQHLRALAHLGPCPIHRRSFDPLRSWLAGALPWAGPGARRERKLRTPAAAHRIFADRQCGARGAADGRGPGRGHAGGGADRSVQSVRDGEVLSRGARTRRAADHRGRPAAERTGGKAGTFAPHAAVPEPGRLSEPGPAGQPGFPERPDPGGPAAD
jgi:hypothetical protein